MLSLFRKFARSWVAAIIIGLLVISFAVWGLSDVFTGGGAGGVAKVAGQSITQADYRAEFDRLLKRAKTEAKRDISTEEARKQGLDNAVLERMVGDRAFGAFVKSLGLGPAKSVVQNEIAKVPGFQNPVSQRFDQTTYLQALQENNYTPQTFEASVRNDLARQALSLAASSGLRAPRAFSSQTLAFGTEQRFVTVVPVPAKLAGPPTPPTNAQLTAFYNESKEALTRPETRALTLAIGDLAEFKAKATPDEAEARKIFERNKAKLSTPAKRSLVQLVATDKAKAELAATRLRAGDAPDAIAKDLGLSAPIILNDVGLTGIPDENVARAAFAAKAGDVATIAAKLQPFAAFKIIAASAAKDALYEESADKIREELRVAAAGEAITDATEAFDKVITEGGTLEAAAAKAGFKLVKIDGLLADGRSIATGQPVPELANSPGVLRDVFAGAKGDVSDLASLPSDIYMAVRVDAITPAAPPPMASITNELASEWLRRDVSTRLKKQADTILAEAKRTNLEAAAAKFKLPALRQDAPLQRGQGGEGLSAAVFGAKRGEIVMSQTANGVEFAIIRIDKVVRDDEAVVPERLAQAETAVRASVQRDLVAALESAARARAKTKLYPDMMRAALGDTTDSGPNPAPAAPPTSPKSP